MIRTVTGDVDSIRGRILPHEHLQIDLSAQKGPANKIGEQEMDAVVEYLTAYFGKVNVNTATAEQLAKSLDLPAKEAQAISAYRKRNGKIKDFEELKKVPGVSAEKLQAKRGLIAFSL